jgi:hypothetical protein
VEFGLLKLIGTIGDALYRFILDHMDLPKVRLHCFGSHIESKITACVGKVDTKETTIIDFNFMIDLSLSMNRTSGELYTFGNNTLAFRGKMDEEVGEAGGPQSVRDWTRSYAESLKTGKKFKFYKVRGPFFHSTLYAPYIKYSPDRYRVGHA